VTTATEHHYIGRDDAETDPNLRPFTFGRTPLNITVVLNLLVERGQGKILANPTVATIDGRKALIRTGDDIPLVTRQIFGNTIIENVITFRAGVTLEIVPKVSSDGHRVPAAEGPGVEGPDADKDRRV
jgi:type II secretory pathway component GspD/PulD (secretin)